MKQDATQVEILTEMVGRTFVSVSGEKGDEEMLFTGNDGRWVKFHYEPDCCARCPIEDICGDLSDLSRAHPTNRAAASARRLRWSERRQAYVDEAGCMVRDRFGQRF